MIALVFSYDVRDPEPFEQVYGPEGEWAQFFRSGDGLRRHRAPARRRDPGPLPRHRPLGVARRPTTRSSARTATSTCAASTRHAFRYDAGAADRDVRERLVCRSLRTMIRGCWGCGDNPTGLHLPLPAAEGLTEYETYFSFGEQHQGGPGIVHGGLVAGALDEAVGLLATWYAFPAVTARIFVRYRHPVPINAELLIRASLERGPRPPAARQSCRRATEPRSSPSARPRSSECRWSTSCERPRDEPRPSAGRHEAGELSSSRYQPRRLEQLARVERGVEMPTIASPRPADTRASTAASM